MTSRQRTGKCIVILVNLTQEQHVNGLEALTFALTTIYRQCNNTTKFACGITEFEQRGAVHSRVHKKEGGLRPVGVGVSITSGFSIPPPSHCTVIVSLTRHSWCTHGESLQLPLISNSVSSASGSVASWKIGRASCRERVLMSV